LCITARWHYRFDRRRQEVFMARPCTSNTYRLAWAAIVTILLGGCLAPLTFFEATDGGRYGSSNPMNAEEAVLASAAHDLPCERSSIVVVEAQHLPEHYVLRGCGQSVTYDSVTVEGDSDVVVRFKLVGRIPIPGLPRASAGPGQPSSGPTER
jgi:hypothetical protein